MNKFMGGIQINYKFLIYVVFLSLTVPSKNLCQPQFQLRECILLLHLSLVFAIIAVNELTK